MPGGFAPTPPVPLGIAELELNVQPAASPKTTVQKRTGGIDDICASPPYPPRAGETFNLFWRRRRRRGSGYSISNSRSLL